MKLKTYLSENDITLKEFHKFVGGSYAHLSRVMNGTVNPSLRLSMDIEQVTRGQVRLIDDREHVKIA